MVEFTRFQKSKVKKNRMSFTVIKSISVHFLKT